MKVRDIANIIEEFAPLSLQASYDNAGLIVGHYDTDVRGIMLAVDLTEDVINEAIERDANMIVTHHPIIFSPLKRLTAANYVERMVELAVRKEVVVYAAHTNLDSAPDGMSWRLGEMLGLRDMKVLEPTSADGSCGFGVVGELENELPTEEYIDFVARTLSLSVMRHTTIATPRVKRIALCTGSGGSLMGEVKHSGAELYITADLRYNDFFEGQNSFTTLDVGHYESEFCAIQIIYDILSKKMINFALHKTIFGANPVHYRRYQE